MRDTAPVFQLQRLTAGHAAPLVAFERDNRAFFAATVPDRGDAYFADFARRHEALLAEQSAGTCHFHVLADDDGVIVGRVNLVDVALGSAELGYRVARSVTGRGVATEAVGRVCVLARDEYGLNELRASTAADNVASQAVLTRNGFRQVSGVEPDLAFRRSL